MKKPIFKYGIEIKKPWSQEMYRHNDLVSEEAKSNIKKVLTKAYDDMWLDIDEDLFDDDLQENFREIGKEITGYSFGDGYDERDVLKETLKELGTSPNYWLKEIYEYLHEMRKVPKLEPGFIGFETKKELEYLKNNQDDANMVSNW